MKKLLTILALAGFMTFGLNNVVMAQDATETTEQEQVAATEQVAAPEATTNMDVEEEVVKTKSFHQVLKDNLLKVVQVL